MDLPCLLPVKTPCTGSSGSADPLYDSCPPYYAQRGRERRRWPAVTGPLAAPRHSSTPPDLSPAAAGAPREAGGRGPGAGPDQSYLSWGGGLARRALEAEAEGMTASGGAGERVREQKPSRATSSEEHQSALSVYDNLRDDLPEVVPMETALLEDVQEPELASGAGVFQTYPEERRVPPPVPLADPSASALRSLLTGIQQQIVRQREEYEERILSLEQRNGELQMQVSGMRANLVQQRRWYHAVQAKILVSERARDAAELRNAGLQKEMEQYFDSFGELNNEAKKTERIVKSF